MKLEHDILQPYQCISCSKRYANYSTLKVHRRSFCRQLQNEMVNTSSTYTLSSFMYDCTLENWTPIFGDMLTCCKSDDEDVTILYVGEVVGRVSRHLSAIFSKFLTSGTIHARIAGAVIDCGYGLQVPVDYIFNGEQFHLYQLIAKVEEDMVDCK